MKDKLGEKIMKILLAQRPKTYSYLMNDGCVDKKSKCPKKCTIKWEINFPVYKGCL